ncbi:hypothetical protein V1294_001044 [Bradyrhizobium sp. AZCC 1678]|uniref:hypothetical protein n=1 Tax=Bradyrhizobium sp. AZCC 1678 TaxID=3117030 RepID=UPI002FF1D7E4
MVADSTVAGFLQTARENEVEALTQHSNYLKFLERVDQEFRKLMVAGTDDNVVARIMVLAAHAYYLSAIRIVLSGQSAAAFTNLRATMECALYGLIMQEEEGADAVWLNRNIDREACRKTFTAANGIRLLKRDPNLRDLAQLVYDASIDFGAHPKPIAVIKNLEINDVGQAYSVSLTSLHAVDSFSVERALIACLETGLACVLIFSQVFPQHQDSREIHSSASALLAEFHASLEEDGFSWPQ